MHNIPFIPGGIDNLSRDNRSSRVTYQYTRNTCMQQPLALVSKQPYFPNMKYLKIVVIFTLSIFCKKNVKIMKNYEF